MPFRPILRLALPLALPLALLLAACGSSGSCYWEWYCYIGGGGLECVWVQRCPGHPPPEPDSLSAQASAFDAGDGLIDLRVELTGDLVDAGRPLSVWLRGPSSLDLRPRSDHAVWWFLGFPPEAIDAIDAQVAGTDVRVVDPVPAAVAYDTPACDLRAVLDLDAVPALPSTATLGDPLFFYAPPAASLGLPGSHHGFVVALTPPDGAPPTTLYLREGEAANLPADRAGRWTVALLLLTEGVCEPDSYDVVLLERVAVDVSPAP